MNPAIFSGWRALLSPRIGLYENEKSWALGWWTVCLLWLLDTCWQRRC